MSKLITVEGLDLSGKTSVIIPYLKSKLTNTDFYADLKSSSISSKIRDIFMDSNLINENTDWRTIAFLSAAARSDMVVQEIIPSLKSGKNVVCDRYVDTSFVYNLGSHTAPVDTILNLSTHLVYPNVTIFSYCSYEEMIKRKESRDDNDHWDIKDEAAYYDKLYRYKAQLSKRQCKVFELDTSGSIEQTYAKLDSIIENL